MHHPLVTQVTEPVRKPVAPTHSLLSFLPSCQCCVCNVAVSSVQSLADADPVWVLLLFRLPASPPGLLPVPLDPAHVAVAPLAVVTLPGQQVLLSLLLPSMLPQQVYNLHLPNAFSLLLQKLSLCVHL